MAERINRFNTMLAGDLSQVEALNHEISWLAKDQNHPDAQTLERISENSRKIQALINEFTFNRQ